MVNRLISLDTSKPQGRQFPTPVNAEVAAIITGEYDPAISAAVAAWAEELAPGAAAAAAPAAVTSDLAGRDMDITDAGGGSVQFTLGGVDVGSAFPLPAAAWSGLTGRPTWTDAVFTADGSTTAADITAWLAQPFDGWKQIVGSATVDEAFIIPSNTKLDTTGATLTSAAGADCRIAQNAACTPLRSTSGDAVVVSGDNTVTSATGAFSSADIGRVLGVAFVDEATRGVNAYGTITAVNSSTSVEITPAPLFSETGGVARIYGRDENIEIRGGTWDRGTNGAGDPIPGVGTQMANIVLYRVDGVRLSGMNAVGADGGRGFGVLLGDCTDVDVDMTADTNADGIHLHGPIRNGRIHISGRSADDLIGITTTDYGIQNYSHGDIEDLDLWADGDPTGHRLVLLATGCAGGEPGGTQYPDGHSIRRVKVHRVRDSSPSKDSLGVATWVQCDDPDSRIEDLTVSNADCDVLLYHNAHGKVTLENVTGNISVKAMPTGSGYTTTAAVTDDLTLVDCTVGVIDTNDDRSTITKLTVRGGTERFLYLGCAAVGSVVLDRLTLSERLFLVENGCAVGAMTFSHCTGTMNSAEGIGVIDGSSTVSEISVHDSPLDSTSTSNGSLVRVKSGSTLGSLRVARSVITDMSELLRNDGAAAVKLFLSDVSSVGCGRIAYGGGGAVVKYANVDFDGVLAPFAADGDMTLSGSGLNAPNATWGVEPAGGTVHVLDPYLRAKVDNIAMAVGDMAYNTNGALACGVGPAISDGTNWKNLYTGAATS